MKYLKVDMDTNALGNYRKNIYHLPVSDFESGRTVPITTLLPAAYLDYVATILARISEDKTAIEIISSEYGCGSLPLDGTPAQWDSPEIGLSYATCRISIMIEDKDLEAV